MKTEYQKPQPIRNIKAFLKSYMQSGSAQRALSRQPSYVEVNNEFMKGRVITGYNTMAHALERAAHAQQSKATCCS